MTRQTVHSREAPEAVGPYAQAVWANDLLFLSAQAPLDPTTGKLVDGDITIQTTRVLDNLEAVLASAGLNLDQVVKCTVFLVDLQDFAAMNAAYEKRFSAPFPSRSTLAVAELPLGASVGIEMIAARQ